MTDTDIAELMDKAQTACRAMADPFTKPLYVCRRHFSDAIRAAESSALERAAQRVELDCVCHGPRPQPWCKYCRLAIDIRALASPAAAPAAEKEPDTIAHMVCPACGWSDATLTVATGKLVCHRCDAEREYEPDRVAKIVTRYLKTAPPSAPVAPLICGPACPGHPDPVAPSLLPRILAALEHDAAYFAGSDTGRAARNLAAELRRYIAEMEAGK